MRRLRLVIYLLLLTVPLQGLAAVVQFKQPCPMEHAMAQTDTDMPHAHTLSSAAKPDCCQDDHSATGTTSPCKPGMECHAGQLSITHVGTLPTQPLAQPDVLVPMELSYTPLALHAIWRPPLPTPH